MLQIEMCTDAFSLESCVNSQEVNSSEHMSKLNFYFEITSYCALKYVHIFCVCLCVYACLSFTSPFFFFNFGGVESAFSRKPFSVAVALTIPNDKAKKLP